MTKVCHNCKDGQVKGGFKKRVKRETISLEKQKEQKIKQVKEKDKKKKLKIMDAIHKEFNSKFKQVSNQTPKLISKCLYCEGTGRR